MQTVFVDCGLNYEIEHGYAEYGHTPSGVHETTYGSHVLVFCNHGYNMVGDNFTVCQADGFWSRNTVCQVEGKFEFIYQFTRLCVSLIQGYFAYDTIDSE